MVPGENDTVAHAQLTSGDNTIMPGSLHNNEFGRLMTQPDQIGALEIQAPYVFVPGIDEHYLRAKAAGAQIVIDLKTEDYGGRGYTCRDLEGHLWSFGSFNPWGDG